MFVVTLAKKDVKEHYCCSNPGSADIYSEIDVFFFNCVNTVIIFLRKNNHRRGFIVTFVEVSSAIVTIGVKNLPIIGSDDLDLRTISIAHRLSCAETKISIF